MVGGANVFQWQETAQWLAMATLLSTSPHTQPTAIAIARQG